MQAELTWPAFESRYRNKEYIGSGGFAKVYKVFDHAKNHYIALKVADVRPEWNKFTLRNEVELINKLPLHRNIARYDACYRFDTGFNGVMDFAILRFYEYGNLEQFLVKEKLSMEDKKLIIQGVLNGMKFLHTNNIIHRDLKAQNILLHREDGVWTPKITDFGLSREILDSGTITNSSIGISYAYAAPEQIQNKKIHRNVDVWAAGVIIYRIIADELPFKGRSEGDHKSAQSQLELSKKIVNLDLPPELETLEEPYRSMVKRCLVLDPTKRAQGADELIQLLQGNSEKNSAAHEQSIPDDGDPTEIIRPIDPQTPVSDMVSEPPAVSVPKTTPPKVEQPPAAESPMPPIMAPAIPNYGQSQDYEIPRDNPTQILGQKVAAQKKQPPLTNNFKPTMGEPSKGFRWWWLALSILLIGLGGGAWWYVTNSNGAKKNGMVSEVEKKKEVPKIPIVQIKQLNPVKANRLDEFEGQLERIKSSKSGLEKLVRQLQILQKDKEMMTHYRLHFLTAKLRAKQNMPREINSALIKSAELAIRNREAKKLVQELEGAKAQYFDEFSKIKKGQYWNGIIEALKITNN